MAVTRRTTTSTSSGLPQDHMTADPNIQIPPTTEGLNDLTHIVTLTNLANPSNTTNLVNPTNSVNPNDRPLPPKIDPPTEPRTEGPVNMEQPLGAQ
uniref:Uncharacterized protein n=1 Tax=Cannabis sativa TaxID=3483 RepID=A0A803NKJ7_CANSA